MKKILMMAALALALSACSNIHPEGVAVESVSGIRLSATLAPKAAVTKAVADNGDGKITASWSPGEKLSILYDVSGSRLTSEAEVKSVDASGAATIEFTVDPSTPDNTACELIYPSSAARDDGSGLKSAEELLGRQSGALDASLDVRVGFGTISPTTPAAGLAVTTPLEPQYALFRFRLEDAGGTAVTCRSLAVTVGTVGSAQTYVSTPAAASGEYYVALPPQLASTKVIFSAIGDTGTGSYRFCKEVSFEAGKFYASTLKMPAQSDDATYVPMGDGKKWSVRNVGASKPEDYGDYYAWGEVAPYYKPGHAYDNFIGDDANWEPGKSAGYTWSSYQWGDGSTFSKYTGSDFSTLQAGDDAATQDMGSAWRMPKLEEWKALLEEDFSWVWVENFNNSGKNGRLVISKKTGYEGSCIFLPAAGYRNDRDFFDAGSYGYYWSSSVNARYPDYAYDVFFSADNALWSDGPRSYGFSVRALAE